MFSRRKLFSCNIEDLTTATTIPAYFKSNMRFIKDLYHSVTFLELYGKSFNYYNFELTDFASERNKCKEIYATTFAMGGKVQFFCAAKFNLKFNMKLYVIMLCTKTTYERTLSSI